MESDLLKILKIRIFENSIWDIKYCDKRFGFKYPGRLPGQIYANFFYYFSKKKDNILDLFAGSGTSIDVGKLMDRKVIAYDLTPSRKEIIPFDILKNTNRFPNNYFQAIFCDPPYFNMNYKLYSNKKTDLANQNLSDFIKSLKFIELKFNRSIKVNGYIGIIISNRRMNGLLIDLEFIVNKIFSKRLILQHKIIVPYYNTKYQKSSIIEHFKRNKVLMIGHRTLFVFQKISIFSPRIIN